MTTELPNKPGIRLIRGGITPSRHKRLALWCISGIFFFIVIGLSLSRIPKAITKVGGDFNMRYNEVQCVKEGINPYDIWSGSVASEKYYGIYKDNPRHAPEQIHAYSPWEYTYMLPMSLLPKRTASFLFHFFCLLILAWLALFSWKEGLSRGGSLACASFCSTAAFLVGPGLNACFDTQNYGILATGSILAMIVALQRNHELLAGLAWAVLMTKPQNGVLFAIPLLISRKWKAVMVAVSVCCLSIIPPALMTGASPVDLVLCLAKIRSDDVLSTTLFPEPIFSRIAGLAGQPSALAASALIGVSVCAWLSLRTRMSEDWLERMFPACLCTVAWTYKMPYDYCILSLVLVYIAGPRSTFQRNSSAGAGPGTMKIPC